MKKLTAGGDGGCCWGGGANCESPHSGRSACLCLLSAGNKSVCHYQEASLFNDFFFLMEAGKHMAWQMWKTGQFVGVGSLLLPCGFKKRQSGMGQVLG